MLCSAGLLNNSGSKLINRHFPAFEYNVFVNRNRGEFVYKPPVNERHFGLLDDFNIEGKFFRKLRDHGMDICSPSAGWIIEIKRNLH